jgi:hypothetical protein
VLLIRLGADAGIIFQLSTDPLSLNSRFFTEITAKRIRSGRLAVKERSNLAVSGAK